MLLWHFWMIGLLPAVAAMSNISSEGGYENVLKELQRTKDDMVDALLEVVKSVTQLENATQGNLENLQKELQIMRNEIHGMPGVQGTPSAVSFRYAKMDVWPRTASGMPFIGRRVCDATRNERHCRLKCESEYPDCKMFGFYPFNNNCVLFDMTYSATEVPTDATENLSVFYPYTTENVNSSTGYSYIMLKSNIANVSWVTFTIQACRDAHLSLQQFRTGIEHMSYEIVFGAGSNSHVSIRRSHLDEVYRLNGQFVHCNEARPMWISWTGGEILLGHGDIVGRNLFARRVENRLYVVRGLAVAGYAGVSGSWSFKISTVN